MMLYTNEQDWHKFHIIRCGINPQQFSFSPPSRQAKVLTYVGRLSGEKGVPVLLESLHLLKQQNYDFQLNLLGDGDARQALEQLVREKGLANNVRFAGFVDQTTIVDTLSNSDIFVLPSFAEGIPVALMEAMAMGVPVIATYVGGVAELVIDKVTGLVTYPSDREGLARAIATYIDDETLCKQIADNAREKVTRDFMIDDQIDKLSQLFRNRGKEIDAN